MSKGWFQEWHEGQNNSKCKEGQNASELNQWARWKHGPCLDPQRPTHIAADFTKACCLRFRCQTTAPVPFGEKKHAAIDGKPAEFTNLPEWHVKWRSYVLVNELISDILREPASNFLWASRSPPQHRQKKALRDATSRSFMDKKHPLFFTTSSVL